MDLSQDNHVPLGFDYSCKNNKCSNIYNSLNSSNSLPIMNLFLSSRNPGTTQGNSGRFGGLGKLNEASMITFDASNVKISALICSSNKFSGEFSENPVSTINCNMNISNNQDKFSEGRDVIVYCPKACQQSDTPIYGAGLYHGDSSICKSAIHQGVIGGDGGKVIVRVQQSGENYNGSLLNGIRSQNHVNDGLKAFIVIKYAPNCPFSSSRRSSFLEEFDSVQYQGIENENESSLKTKHFINSLLEDNKNNKNKNIPITNNNINESNNNGYRFNQLNNAAQNSQSNKSKFIIILNI